MKNKTPVKSERASQSERERKIRNINNKTAVEAAARYLNNDYNNLISRFRKNKRKEKLLFLEKFYWNISFQ